MPQVKLRNSTEVSLSKLPNECPYCHKSINPILIADNQSQTTLEIIFRCPNLECNKAFIGTYWHNYSNEYDFGYCNIGEPEKMKFSESIENISPSFIKIYNEAFFSEQHNLTEICGVGYRKALEFLIKDYLIKNNPDKEDKIKSKFLGNCIKDYVSDLKIKKVSERAVWLGNDETHYVRVWEEKSLEDLKKLIMLTIHWIDMEELTNSFEEEMPVK